MRFLRSAILWIVLLILALFVIFLEFVADVGGRAEPIRQPSGAPSGFAPAGRGLEAIEAMLVEVAPADWLET